MHVRASPAWLEVWAPAKLNLFLEVLAKRPDGFHEIVTLMCPIRLYDTLRFRPNDSGKTTFTCRSENRRLDAAPSTNAAEVPKPSAEDLPLDQRNSVVRALELLKSHTGNALGAEVRLIKRIPIAAGLAGGSTDAAAALVAGNQGWKLGLNSDELRRLAAEIGSDIPFFLGSGAAVCTGRGERIEPLSGLGQLHFVLVYPPQGLSTAEVYRACRPAERPAELGLLVDSLRRGDLAAGGKQLQNRLEPAARALSPWVTRLREIFSDLDVLGHQMSGSGTSYFGLCRHAGHAARLANHLRSRRLGQVYAVGSGN
jgi:4-diphosphocytidyl-2-C-methyl-D-erythritol kinase